MRKSLFPFLMIGAIITLAAFSMAACSTPTPSSSPAVTIPSPQPSTSPETSTATPIPSSPPTRTVAATQAATATATATLTPTTPPSPTASSPVYLDDRSSPSALMQSFASALNLHQYERAYSYWRSGAAQLQPFAEFQAGYANTQSVELTTGTVTVDAGAGQRYYAVPVSMLAQTRGGVTQTFVGCYVLHISQPAIQGVPPFEPLAIDRASVQQVVNTTDTASLMGQACQGYPGLPLTPTPTPAPNDIGPERYLDDRSNAAEVLRSFFNAINRHEYVRAYSYWEPGAPDLTPFDQFQNGYANTASVQLTLGTVLSQTGAGQFYYRVPAALVATTTGGATQTFVGCYRLHLASPDAQATPPFRPLAIIAGNEKPVANGADLKALLAQACQ